MEPILEVQNLDFIYEGGQSRVEVLRGLNMKIAPGEFVAIQGPSGSGKSTLFYILGFLLKPTSGSVFFEGQNINSMTSDEMTCLRNQKIGFVFQQFHLLAKTSALNNILLPTFYPSEMAKENSGKRTQALKLAGDLGLSEHLKHYPNQLSGGQQQRVAIARALINDCDLILADEPTGNLDSKTARQIMDLLIELNNRGKTIILITHDNEVAQKASRILHLKDGAFTHSEELRQIRPPSDFKPHPLSMKLAGSFQQYKKIAKSVFPLVIKNLLRQKAKSILTMLGVVIGIAAVLAMVTLGQFVKKRVMEGYETLGVNKVIIRGYPNWHMKATDAVSVNFRFFDVDRDLIPLKEIFPEISKFSPFMTTGTGVTAGGLNISDNVTSLGVGSDYLAITNRTLFLGRALSPYHVESRSPVCLIGYEIATRLFSAINPLNQIISVGAGSGAFPCKVIGVFAPVTSNKDWSPPNLQIILPYTYFQTVVTDWWNANIHAVALQLENGSEIEDSAKKIKSYFSQKYGKSGQFYVDSDSTLIAQMKRFLNLFSVLISSIAFLSLIVGGIGINNMMLVSVTERFREFGIRKALGATDRSIRLQVLLESLVLCSIAGLVGAILGFGCYELLIFGASNVVPNMKFAWVVDPIALTLSVVSIFVVGIASGLVPALRAEKLQVIEALRAE